MATIIFTVVIKCLEMCWYAFVDLSELRLNWECKENRARQVFSYIHVTL